MSAESTGVESSGGHSCDQAAWLVVVDPQVIFADPSSQWCAPRFPEIVDPLERLVAAFGERTLVTRWLPDPDHPGSWDDYFRRWTFADLPSHDPLLDLVPAARGWASNPTLDVPTFSKWGPGLSEVTGAHPRLVLTGVATDCCVLSTALAAADGGAWVTVVSDACAGSDDAHHAAALDLMGLYAPQIEVASSREVLARPTA